MPSSTTMPPLPDPVRHNPFRAGEFRQALGLKQLTPSEWLEIDSQYPVEIARKQSLLGEHRAEVLSVRDTASEACREVFELTADHLVQQYPAWFEMRGGVLHDHINSRTMRLDAARLNPLDAAASLVQEDLCIMQENGGVYRLTAACVCFPSRWSLAEKIDKPMAEIHGPVPRYASQIGAASDRFLLALTPGKIVGRFNWSLHDSPELFKPDSPPMWTDIDSSQWSVGDGVWVRIERQTLRRLEKSEDILFTIRTHVHPLKDVASTPEGAVSIASALKQWPQDVIQYKGCAHVIGSVLSWLELRSQAC